MFFQSLSLPCYLSLPFGKIAVKDVYQASLTIDCVSEKKNKCHFLPPIKYHIPFVCNLYLRNECNTNTTVYCSTYHLFWQLSFIIYAIVLHFVFPLCFVTNYASENCVYIGYILKLAYVLLQGPIYLYTKIHSNRNRRSYFRL